MKRPAWIGFWVYQIVGCISAAYYWDEMVEFFHLVNRATAETLKPIFEGWFL